MTIPSGTQACAACKYQRRKCAPDCILAPYFPPHHLSQFLNAHKLFGVSNILKIIRNLHPLEKSESVRTMIFEAGVRANDPVGGCYRIIREFQRQIDHGQAELDLVLHQLAICRSQAHRQGQILLQEESAAAAVLESQPINPDPVDSYNPMHYSNIHGHLHQQQSLNQWGMHDSSKIKMECEDIKPTSLVFENFDERFDHTKELVEFSNRAEFKEEDTDSMTIQQVQEHDLKGAASLFTLTNCSS
ncbi:hypothetical protein HHK36_014306 [Tetracentron sinense]|uniref:LOB domain-containing protein n=1 Tax=Tetracentron sinense TaxID=13715 RepID=A0A834Z9I5_TETSI|nr:hypothetical protein HHK36_014306 [Tetracentron sinense]